MTYESKSATGLPDACIWRFHTPLGPAIHRTAKKSSPAMDSEQNCVPYPALGEEAYTEAARCVARLRDPDLPVRHVAAMRLAKLGSGVVPLLLPILRKGEWTRQLEAAFDVLKQLGSQRTVPEVAALLDASSEHVRLASLRTLRWLSNDPAIFTPALTDLNWRVRREAVFALIELRREDLATLFESMLRDNHAKVRAAAANALGILGLSNYTHALIQLLDDPASIVRNMAVWSLSRLEGRAVGACVLALIREPVSPRNMVLAARALAIYPEPAATNAVIAAADNAGSWAQYETVKAVAPLGNPQNLPFLETMLRNGTVSVRKAAAWGIGVHTLRCVTRREKR